MSGGGFAGAVTTPPAAPESTIGYLALTILWPTRPPGQSARFRGQLIPDSTSRIDISIRALGTEVASGSVNPAANQATASITVSVPANNNLLFQASAFARASGPIAQGTAVGINVSKGQTTATTLVMGSLYTPTITSLTPASEAVGATISVDGTNSVLPGLVALPRSSSSLRAGAERRPAP